jgi:hypothetical protein
MEREIHRKDPARVILFLLAKRMDFRQITGSPFIMGLALALRCQILRLSGRMVNPSSGCRRG